MRRPTYPRITGSAVIAATIIYVALRNECHYFALAYAMFHLSFTLDEIAYRPWRRFTTKD